MKIYSLVGKSGTGKSYQAVELCDEYGIESIIDDGLFIIGGSIISGVSAKRQETKIKAIKTAMFENEDIRRDVARAIGEMKPESIMVLGTSDRMIDIITSRLGLPDAKIRFDINEVTTPEDREMARRQRDELGQHVIPVPTMQIKKDFSGYFIHPLRQIRGVREDIRDGRGKLVTLPKSAGARGVEKSIVRPAYSYLGSYSISDKAIVDIVRHVADTFDDVDSAPHVSVNIYENGAVIKVDLILRWGTQIVDSARKLQKNIADKVNELTSVNILAIDIEIHGLMWFNSKQ